MNLNFLKSSEKKELISQLEELYGISKLDYLLLETGREKIRGFSGTMTKEEIVELSEIANVEIVGMYLFKKEGNLRISFDGTQILGDKIVKSIVKIDGENEKKWLMGENIILEGIESGIYVVQNSLGDFLGCGVSDGKKVLNYIPKERRVRKS